VRDQEAYLPLSGVRVLCLAEQFPGPYATMILSDLGADIILVERPGIGDPSRSFAEFHASLARGKRSLALDLKSPGSHAVMERLVAQSDVFIEGFRPGTMARLGWGERELKSTNPDIVIVSISGYGQSGPYSLRPGHDLSYQGVAGLLEGRDTFNTSEPPWADLVSALFSVIAVLTGLHARSAHGSPPMADVSMLDCLASVMTPFTLQALNNWPALEMNEPAYGIFRTGSGERLTLSIAHEQAFWDRLCPLVGMGHAVGMQRKERLAKATALASEIQAGLHQRPFAYWAEALDAADIPWGPVHERGAVSDDRQAQARGLFPMQGNEDDSTAMILTRQPIVYGNEKPGPRGPAPRLGEHTRTILQTLGFSDGEISALLASGAVAQQT
jgi:crotonobetainyl-CoA:carnitine CoA-transferase CaiB-like acyl-CoA transferase